MREIQQLCSCAGIGWELLLLCQLIESKAPNPKKVQEHPKSKRKTSIIQDPKERPRASKIRRKTKSIQIQRKTKSIQNPKKNQQL